MPSKELTNQVAISAGITKKQAQAAISTILAALQEPTEGMRQAYRDANCWPNEETIWRAMLNASPLGEQSE